MKKLVLLLCLPICLGQFLLAQTPKLIFEVSFENTLDSEAGEKAAIGTGLSFEEGIKGMGVQIGSGDVLQYPVKDNINSSAGSMTLWVRPAWNPGGVLYRIMVLGDDPRNFELHVDEDSNLAFSVNTSQVDDKPIKVVFGSAGAWNKNDWNFLSYTWSSDNIKIYLNGQLLGQEEVGFEIPGVSDINFHLGSFLGEHAFNGTIDELRIYDAPLPQELVHSQYLSYMEDLTANAISVFDIFGQDVTSGITLVDWEGPVRNPALKYHLKGSDDLSYPLNVELTTKEELAFFNLPSTISKNGPAKTIKIESPDEMQSFLFSVFMDENFESENFDLVLRYTFNDLPAKQVIPVQVIDQDIDRPLTYPVIVDFSEARSPFMLDDKTQSVIRQAAEHWLYYVDGENIDTIAAGESFLYIGGNDHLFEEKRVNNPLAYKGFYLYAYGNTNEGPCICSTGFPNRELLQTSNGIEVPIFRIGGLHLNLLGQAWDSPPTGWEVLSAFENWTQQDYIGTDLYMLAQHEIGHAMVFENSPLFLEAQNRLGFTSPALTAYYPDKVVPLFPNSLSHVIGVLDPASQVTPYGGGVDDEVMPLGRGIITKLDILIMESVGYPIRDNEVTRLLSLTADGSFDGVQERNYEVNLVARGGVPIYQYQMIKGVLPQGLELDIKTGKISGVPKEHGDFPVTFMAKDYDERSLGTTIEAMIKIREFPTGADQISVDSNIKIYPNPSKGKITVSMDNPETGNIDFTVFDLTGKEVKRKSINKTSTRWNEKIDLQNILPGIYLLNVRYHDSSRVIKFIIN